jgi:ribonucleoside-triphosphate reductase (formate)
MAKIILDSSDLKYEIVDAEENLDLTNQFKIQQAPTLVVVSSGNVQSFANVSNIKKYVKG